MPSAAEHAERKERMGAENIEKDEEYARVLKLVH